MNGLLILLLSSWISSAASKVVILYVGTTYKVPYKGSVRLDCKITDGETFKAWLNPTGYVHNSTDYVFETDGDEHKLEIKGALMRDAGKWTCLSNEGGSAEFTLQIGVSLAKAVDQNQNLVKGLPGAVKINVLGYPTPIFEWTKDGTKITPSGRFGVDKNGTLTISKVEESDSGVYQLETRQPPDKLPDEQITVVVFVLPTFTSVAVNESRQLGGELAINCAATGKPIPVISWEKDGVAVVPSGRYTIDSNGLTVKNIQMNDTGSYTCVAINEAGSEKQASKLESILVTIIGTPVKTHNLVKGALGTVAVNIVGYPKPDFKWKKDGVDVVAGGRISVAGDGSLVISAVQITDAGTYEVMASQKGSKQEIKDIVVNVHVPPTFISKSIQESRTVGGSITFICNATGIPAPKITWKKGSDNVNADARHQVTGEGLTITGIVESDVGDYSCVANNSVGEETQMFALTSVLVAPQMSDLGDQDVEKGEALKVNCSTTSGKPPAQVEWKKNGVAVPDERQQKYPGGNVLAIDDIQPADSGTYECFAKNGAVDDAGKEVVLNRSMEVGVIYPPEFDAASTQSVSAFGKEVEMKCVVNGKPAPNVSLSFSNKDIKGKLARTETQTTLTVLVNITEVSDYGVYTCTASNELKDGIKHEIRASIPLKKPVISGVTSKCNNVTFSVQQDMTGPIQIKDVLVIVTQGSVSVHNELIEANKINNRKTIGRLQEETDYKLSVKQVTGVDGIGYTVYDTFKTDTCELQKINDFDFNEGGVVIYWPEAKGNVDYYIVKYRIKGDTDWKEQQSKTLRAQIADLEVDKTYQFQVFVKLNSEDAKELTSIQEKLVKKGDPDDKSKSTTRAPETVSRKKGLSGGAIAAIVIVIILLVLIAVDIFCCFFNQCGVVHMCAAAACSNKGKSKYDVDGKTEEGTKLKEIEGEEPVA